tara:strand:- start:257 stop:805 length:549 start_codon:yes stop_codon:yes gene_type:complete
MKKSLAQTSKKLNIKLSFKTYENYLGLPFEKIINKMKIKTNVLEIKKNYEFFSLKSLNNIKIDKKKINDLKKLKNFFFISVFTSKSKMRTSKILKKYKFFDYCISSDDVKKGKPDPEGLLKILNKFRLNNKDAIFVGDSIYDYKASKAAKIKYLHAKWGYQKNNFSKKINIINRLLDIKKFL